MPGSSKREQLDHEVRTSEPLPERELFSTKATLRAKWEAACEAEGDLLSPMHDVGREMLAEIWRLRGIVYRAHRKNGPYAEVPCSCGDCEAYNG
jgi:hypothetical protein